jgi:hypothetical protein
MTIPHAEYLETTLARLETKVDGINSRLDMQNGRVLKLEDRANCNDVLVGKLSTELKIKAGIWGAIGAGIPTAVGVIWMMVKG